MPEHTTREDRTAVAAFDVAPELADPSVDRSPDGRPDDEAA